MASLLSLLTDAEEVAQVVEDARRDIRYVITDFSAELVISKFKENAEAEGDIYVPEYQRGLAWSDDKKSYFIESLLLRIPTPPVFFYEVEGRLEIVDGSQRIRTLVSFAKDGFSLRGLEKLDALNGFEFSKLPISVQRRLNNTPIRSYVLDQGTDESTRVDLFRRLNTSGKRLQDAEIRKGAFRGAFLDLVIECAASELFLEVVPHLGGRSDSQSERQELVTRLFVYAERYLDFRHDVRKFLDARMVEFNKTLSDSELDRLRAEFQTVMRFVLKFFPSAFYRSEKGKLVPRVRFEAIAVGALLALRADPKLTPKSVEWLRSPEFEQLVRTDASNSAPKLRARIEFVRDRLLGK
ncbi:DUF262 domain-containing protein [Bradyrhizobium sp. SZCCHNS2015]|uniref:DUF262 domain-containing protein n=1 Tax=Bradyrhizobium sp. SZCCHNS2015 TaxID=3057305 RepID=UPI0028ED9B34|nr:DUF262 domain-containing protein [Bradyrhizobium sp. SZCCHNS2015]